MGQGGCTRRHARCRRKRGSAAPASSGNLEGNARARRRKHRLIQRVEAEIAQRVQFEANVAKEVYTERRIHTHLLRTFFDRFVRRVGSFATDVHTVDILESAKPAYDTTLTKKSKHKKKNRTATQLREAVRTCRTLSTFACSAFALKSADCVERIRSKRVGCNKIPAKELVKYLAASTGTHVGSVKAQVYTEGECSSKESQRFERDAIYTFIAWMCGGLEKRCAFNAIEKIIEDKQGIVGWMLDSGANTWLVPKFVNGQLNPCIKQVLDQVVHMNTAAGQANATRVVISSPLGLRYASAMDQPVPHLCPLWDLVHDGSYKWKGRVPPAVTYRGNKLPVQLKHGIPTMWTKDGNVIHPKSIGKPPIEDPMPLAIPTMTRITEGAYASQETQEPGQDGVPAPAEVESNEGEGNKQLEEQIAKDYNVRESIGEDVTTWPRPNEGDLTTNLQEFFIGEVEVKFEKVVDVFEFDASKVVLNVLDYKWITLRQSGWHSNAEKYRITNEIAPEKVLNQRLKKNSNLSETRCKQILKDAKLGLPSATWAIMENNIRIGMGESDMKGKSGIIQDPCRSDNLTTFEGEVVPIKSREGQKTPKGICLGFMTEVQACAEMFEHVGAMPVIPNGETKLTNEGDCVSGGEPTGGGAEGDGDVDAVEYCLACDLHQCKCKVKGEHGNVPVREEHECFCCQGRKIARQRDQAEDYFVASLKPKRRQKGERRWDDDVKSFVEELRGDPLSAYRSGVNPHIFDHQPYDPECPACRRAKAKVLPQSRVKNEDLKEEEKAKVPGERQLVDLCGPFPISPGYHSYVQVSIDEADDLFFVEPLRGKTPSSVATAIAKFKNLMEEYREWRGLAKSAIWKLKSDLGSEFIAEETRKMMSELLGLQEHVPKGRHISKI